jgi:uncharacterized protein (TIGR02466 family)
MILVSGFSSGIYKDRLKYSRKQELINQITSRYHAQQILKPKSWDEDVHTSIVYNTYKTPNEYFDKSFIPIDLVDLVDQKLQQLIHQENLQTLGKFYISEMWYNAYAHGQYQHMHKHSNGNNNVFSGIYYLKFNPNKHTCTRFYNPAFEIDFDKVRHHKFFCFMPEVVEDDLLMFASDIGHDVPAQYSSELRITVSFNVTCKYYESMQYI